MNLEDEIAKVDANRDMNDDETKELILKPCIKRNQVKKAKDYDGTYNPCFYCNHYGTYTMFGHKYKCDEYSEEKDER